MKYLAFASLAVFALITAIAVFVVLTATPANAVVCAKGVYRAGCVGPRSAAVAHFAALICEQRGTEFSWTASE